MDIPPGLKVRYPDLVFPLLRVMLPVPPAGSCSKFPLPPSDTYPTFTSKAILSMTLYGLWPTLPWWRGRIWIFRKYRGDNKVESKLEGLVVLGFFVVSTLTLLHMLGFPKGLVNPPLWELTNFRSYSSFISPNIVSSSPHSITDFIEAFPPY